VSDGPSTGLLAGAFGVGLVLFLVSIRILDRFRDQPRNIRGIASLPFALLLLAAFAWDPYVGAAMLAGITVGRVVEAITVRVGR
jgi:hypothetical protein